MNHRDTIPSPTEQANILNTHYSKTCRLPHRREDREIIHRLHALTTDRNLPPPFTTTMTRDAIKATKNTGSTGPDGISHIHLKHLGQNAIRALTSLFNHSIIHNTIPNIWKTAKIIPILKTKKTPTEPASYRPISLLCNPSKILERLVLNNITQHLTLSPFQHGFRPQHSTTTLLTNITQTTLEGLNHSKPAKRTLIAAIDISKAFDTVPRHLLTQKILNTDMHPNYKKWLANFLAGRHGYTEYNGKASRTKHYTNGVPQGAVLSPSLFNLYTHDIPQPTQHDTQIMTYADDLTIIAQHSNYNTAAANMQQYVHELEQWLQTNRMTVAPAKSTLTLITPYKVEYHAHPRVTLNGTPIPLTEEPTILGLTLDRGMTFRAHTDNVNAKAQKRINVLRALTNTSAGHSKEDILTTYKQFIRPVLTYAHPAWHSDLAKTHMRKLQTTQNTALRVATGCTRSTPTPHLHDEARVLPLGDHMDMRGTHIYTSTSDMDHPLHYMQNPRPTDRHLHLTPAEHYHALYNTLPPIPPNTSHRTHIHTHFTDRALRNAEPNHLLGARPPRVDDSEQTLPRVDRVHLARLRCGHHPSIPAYAHRIGRALTDQCTWCLNARGTLEHVFLHCPALQPHRATHNIHTLHQLWTHPIASLHFLRDVGVT